MDALEELVQKVVDLETLSEEQTSKIEQLEKVVEYLSNVIDNSGLGITYDMDLMERSDND